MEGKSTVNVSPQQPPSIISLEAYRDPRAIKFVDLRHFDGVDYERERNAEIESLVKIIRNICRTSLVIASVLFISQVGVAACLCRPVVVIGGMWLSFLFLFHGAFGDRVIRFCSKSLLIGFACLSGFVSLSSLASAIYLLSGNFVVICISRFHGKDDSTVTRLYIVEGISLIASIPCMLGSVTCFIATVLSTRASQKSEVKRYEPKLFLYLQDPAQNGKTSPRENAAGCNNQKRVKRSPSAPLPQDPEDFDGMESLPPPYHQINEESFA